MLGQAAKLSYYFVLAVFPLLILVVALLAYVRPGNVLLESLLADWRHVLPHDAYTLIVDTLTEIRKNTGSGKLSIGLLGTLWAASNGVSAVMDGLNKAYEVREGRPWWKAQLVAIALTIAGTVFVLTALALVLGGEHIAYAIARYARLGKQFEAAWAIAQWPLVLLFVLIAVALLYRFAPDLHGLEWSHIVPGAVVSVTLWLIVSSAFRVYLRYFNHYGTTYGSLGAMIILMLWFYLTGAAILVGGEVNSEIENAAARRGAPDARLPGQKGPGEPARRA